MLFFAFTTICKHFKFGIFKANRLEHFLFPLKKSIKNFVITCVAFVTKKKISNDCLIIFLYRKSILLFSAKQKPKPTTQWYQSNTKTKTSRISDLLSSHSFMQFSKSKNSLKCRDLGKSFQKSWNLHVRRNHQSKYSLLTV